MNKTISIDVDLMASLEKLSLNVSEYCNERLWDYVTKLEGVTKNITLKEAELVSQIEVLQEQQAQLIKNTELDEQMKEEGITEEKRRFLKNMPINIMVAKDMKLGWFRNFGEEKDWSELLNLKKKWG